MVDMRWPQKLFYLALAYALFFVLVFSVPLFVHRRAFDQAFSAWYKNPTTRNAAALRIQQHKNELIRVEVSAMGALISLVLVSGIHGGLRIAKRFLASNDQP